MKASRFRSDVCAVPPKSCKLIFWMSVLMSFLLIFGKFYHTLKSFRYMYTSLSDMNSLLSFIASKVFDFFVFWLAYLLNIAL